MGAKRIAVVGVVLLFFAAGLFVGRSVRLPGFQGHHDPVRIADLDQGLSNLADIARPAVVNLEMVAEEDGGNPFSRFFGEFFGDRSPRLETRSGSGFVVRQDGCIVTNAHVVAGGKHLRVTFANGAEYRGRVLARDDSRDLAVVKIDAKQPLPALALGDVKDIRAGSLVMAVGSPFRFAFSFTEGIVSALGRKADVGKAHYTGLIQTDAAVNQGNSGGPLVDVHGDVVGITAALYSPSGTNTGIGFAIPMDAATKRAISSMMRKA